MQKSYYPKAGELTQQWHIVDASGQTLGRLAARIATVLLGKHRANFTPGVDMGDYVIVTNCGKLIVTGNKLEEKTYYRHSGYPGGLTETSLRRMLSTHPERVIQAAVRGMLPHTKQGRQLIKKLKVYAGTEHPHGPQNPQPLTMN